MDSVFWFVVAPTTALAFFGAIGAGVETVVSFRNLAIREGFRFAALTATCAFVSLLMVVVIFDVFTLH